MNFQCAQSGLFYSRIRIFNMDTHEAAGAKCMLPLSPYQKAMFNLLVPLVFFVELFCTMMVHRFWYLLKNEKFNLGITYFRSFIALVIFSYTQVCLHQSQSI